MTLKGADRVRKRPAVIFGSDGIEGCQHSAFEILSNSIDEAREGYGKEIRITRFADHSVEIEDFGRGIPVDYNKNEERYNWELVFCELYAGGKYNNSEAESYEFSLGLNGLGLCSTQYSSEYMDVEIRRDETLFSLHFGGFDEQEFVYENGIEDHVKELVGEDALSTVQLWQTERMVRDRDDKPEYKTKINIALAFSNKISTSEYYHKSSWLEYGGAPEKAVRNAFVYSIDSYLKANGKYTKNEAKINFDDVKDCLVIVISSFSSVTSYENQTKKAITNKGIQDAMTEYLRHQLEVYFIENKLEAEKISGQVLINKRSRESAEKTRLNIKKTLAGNMDMTGRVAKFVDCRSKDKDERELFIVEGDSALGACKQARNPDFQAIMPIRGKILNCLKADYNKIFKSEIITDLLKVLGCGVEVKSKANKDLATFDLELLRWNKIIFCTDADVDGFHIRTLLMTMIYRLAPTLIREGKVYIAESPLYEITSKEKVYFAYTEAEKERFIKEIGDKKYTIQRSKGLGENEPEMMSLTTMDPSTRRLIKIMPDDAKKTAEMFDILLGDNLALRRDYIVENGAKYIDDIDVS